VGFIWYRVRNCKARKWCPWRLISLTRKLGPAWRLLRRRFSHLARNDAVLIREVLIGALAVWTRTKRLTSKFYFDAGFNFTSWRAQAIKWTQLFIKFWIIFFFLHNIRPFSEDELRSNVPRVVTCNENKREVTVMQTLANKQVDRVFTFDKVGLYESYDLLQVIIIKISW